jgi:hypothetical protein
LKTGGWFNEVQPPCKTETPKIFLRKNQFRFQASLERGIGPQFLRNQPRLAVSPNAANDFIP